MELILLMIAAGCAWLGAFGGVCGAKLFRRQIRHTWIDAVLGIAGFLIGFIAYTALTRTVITENYAGNGEKTAGAIGALLLPVTHQGLRAVSGYLGKAFSN